MGRPVRRAWRTIWTEVNMSCQKIVGPGVNILPLRLDTQCNSFAQDGDVCLVLSRQRTWGQTTHKLLQFTLKIHLINKCPRRQKRFCLLYKYFITGICSSYICLAYLSKYMSIYTINVATYKLIDIYTYI